LNISLNIPSSLPLRFQLISNPHLKTSLSYAQFFSPTTFPIHAPHLFPLGAIILVKHPQLFSFLSSPLDHIPFPTIYYIIGTHETLIHNRQTRYQEVARF
jgi:hypothetical protein